MAHGRGDFQKVYIGSVFLILRSISFGNYLTLKLASTRYTATTTAIMPHRTHRYWAEGCGTRGPEVLLGPLHRSNVATLCVKVHTITVQLLPIPSSRCTVALDGSLRTRIVRKCVRFFSLHVRGVVALCLAKNIVNMERGIQLCKTTKLICHWHIE